MEFNFLLSYLRTRIEQKEIEETIEKHNKAGHKYKKLGLQLYEVSQRAKEFYVKKLPEKRLLLLGLIFAKMELKGTILSCEHTKAFKILAKLVDLTNNSTKVDKKDEIVNTAFIPEEKIDKSIQTSNFIFLHPDVREALNDVRIFYTQNY